MEEFLPKLLQLIEEVRLDKPADGAAGPAIDHSMDLLDNGILDSLGVLQVISLVETTCDIEIDFLDVDPEIFFTVDSVCAFVADASQ